MRKPCKNWSGFTIIDGPGKVFVSVNNGYLKTGYSNLNEALPKLLRCIDSDGRREWVWGATEIPVPELREMFPNAVVQHYQKLRKDVRIPTVLSRPTPVERHPSAGVSTRAA